MDAVLAANCATVISRPIASSATLALNSAEYLVHFLVIAFALSIK
jgi:hypothetical protein